MLNKVIFNYTSRIYFKDYLPQSEPIIFSGKVDVVDINLEEEVPDIPNNLVEVEPGKKAKYNRGTSHQKMWLFGMKERGSNKCFSHFVTDCKKETLCKSVLSNVKRDLHINHDGWASCTFLVDYDFSHSHVNHSVEFKASDGTHTNGIKGFYGPLCHRISSMHGCPYSYIENVVSEFCYPKAYGTNGSVWETFLQYIHESKMADFV